MEIVFADSFWKSLKKLNRHRTWWYKTYNCLKYDLPWFFRNINRFRRELWYYRTWDASCSLYMFRRGLELNSVCLQKYGNEVDEVRLKKISMIDRAVELINIYNLDKYISIAESELGLKTDSSYLFTEVEEPEEILANNRKIFARAQEIEEQQWGELWELVKGRKPTIETKEQHDAYYSQDGSGLKGWWD